MTFSCTSFSPSDFSILSLPKVFRQYMNALIHDCPQPTCSMIDHDCSWSWSPSNPLAHDCLLSICGKEPLTNLSVFSSPVILNERGLSRGYGFIRFNNEVEQQTAMTSMNGISGLGGKPIKVSAVNRIKGGMNRCDHEGRHVHPNQALNDVMGKPFTHRRSLGLQTAVNILKNYICFDLGDQAEVVNLKERAAHHFQVVLCESYF